MPTFAAIDIGSNSVRLKISRLQAGRLKEIHEDREVTRLGEGVFQRRTAFAGGDVANRPGVAALQSRHAGMRDGFGEVVATAALRDARNSRIFLEWVRSTTGWTIEIISGLEEARLIHLGILASGRMDATAFCWWTSAAAVANSRFRATDNSAIR
jgi:exopolyphosphatase / guanosine-5'-triphosphate,3'-diphosphate pyrophosphatase